MTTMHRLKTLPTHFEGIVSGDKTFDVRYDEVGYQAGDHVLLSEWDPGVECGCRDTSRVHLEDCARYTGRERIARIGWVTASTPKVGTADGGWNGNGFVVFSLCDVVEPVAALGEQWDTVEVETMPQGMARVAAAIKAGERR